MSNIKTGDVVKLEAISKEAKDMVGDKWIVEAITEKMLFDDKVGIWVCLREKSGNYIGFRWVHLTNDEHFKIIQ